MKALKSSPAVKAQAQTLAHQSENNKVNRLDMVRIAFVGAVVLLGWLQSPHFEAIGGAAALIGSYPIFKEAIASLHQRRMTMELSMSIALLAALAISEVFTALVIVFFVLSAEALEKLTVSRGRNIIGQLLSFLPQVVFIRSSDGPVESRLEDVKPGDVVVIKPGARVPVDGTVVSGHSFIDQSTITGESMPAEKLPGSTVYAGTINQSGSIDVKTTQIGQDTAFGKIIHAVENAERSQAPVQKTADRLAGYLVYFAMGCALLTFFITGNLKSTIAVVIVAGACGIAAGTPLAILGAIGLAARAGSIIKGGLFIELLGAIDTVVFDKTGTLTCGAAQVVEVKCLNGTTAREVLAAAAAAESISEHPLGKAIVAQAQQENLTIAQPEKFNYIPGKGISCLLDSDEILAGNKSLFECKNYDKRSLSTIPDMRSDTSAVIVGRAGTISGIIYIADAVRPEAKLAIADLKAMGIQTILLTGDSKPIAAAIAAELSISTIAAEVLPADKQDYIRKLVASGRRVAMVGDGINDAPALMEAGIGVAIGSGTDVARESADVVLIGNDLGRFVETVRIARRCKQIIMTNFAGTLAVDGAGVLLAAAGYLSPMLAAFIHVSSELVFILNSARLLPVQVKWGPEHKTVPAAGNPIKLHNDKRQG